jgi:hypothetical protein
MVETGLSGAIPTRFPLFPLSGAILAICRSTSSSRAISR